MRTNNLFQFSYTMNVLNICYSKNSSRYSIKHYNYAVVPTLYDYFPIIIFWTFMALLHNRNYYYRNVHKCKAKQTLFNKVKKKLDDCVTPTIICVVEDLSSNPIKRLWSRNVKVSIFQINFDVWERLLVTVDKLMVSSV